MQERNPEIKGVYQLLLADRVAVLLGNGLHAFSDEIQRLSVEQLETILVLRTPPDTEKRATEDMTIDTQHLLSLSPEELVELARLDLPAREAQSDDDEGWE